MTVTHGHFLKITLLFNFLCVTINSQITHFWELVLLVRLVWLGKSIIVIIKKFSDLHRVCYYNMNRKRGRPVSLISFWRVFRAFLYTSINSKFLFKSLQTSLFLFSTNNVFFNIKIKLLIAYFTKIRCTFWQNVSCKEYWK